MWFLWVLTFLVGYWVGWWLRGHHVESYWMDTSKWDLDEVEKEFGFPHWCFSYFSGLFRVEYFNGDNIFQVITYSDWPFIRIWIGEDEEVV